MSYFNNLISRTKTKQWFDLFGPQTPQGTLIEGQGVRSQHINTTIEKQNNYIKMRILSHYSTMSKILQ